MDSPPPDGKHRIPAFVVVMVLASGLAAAALVVVLIANPLRQAVPSSIIFVTPTQVVYVVISRPTDVPTVTLVPPTPTVTSTPTITPTSTPVPPSDTPLPPTITPIPPTATRKPPPVVTARRCVAVIGDSVAHGDAVFEIPGVGYLQAQMTPVSRYIDAEYRQRGVTNMQVLNRSSSAVGISSGNHPLYFGTAEYAQLLLDGCQYNVIIPWINDLSSGVDGGAAAPAHVLALSALARAIIAKNPATKVLIVNYYQGAAAPFALSSFASGFTSGNVAAFNGQIAAACAGGALAMPQIRCVDSNAAFAGMGLAQVVGPLSKHDFDTLVVSAANPDQANQVQFYFDSNPDGALVGDGVHLSGYGKAQLAAYLVSLMP